LPILHTALHSEAKIFKEEFNLSKIESYRKIEIFSRDDIVLVVSGIGKISTSIAIALASVLKPNCRDFYLNFGIAGSAKKEHALGDLRMIDKVVDLATSRSYFSDFLIQSELISASLGTSDLPVAKINPVAKDGLQSNLSKMKYIQPSEIDIDLYDMEASAFYQSAIYFADSHRIHSLKIVSDHLEGIYCKAEDVEYWAEQQKDRIFTFLEENRNFLTKETSSKHTSSHQPSELMNSILEEIQSNLRLTASQKSELKKAYEYWDHHTKHKDDSWKKFLYTDSDKVNKAEGKIRLQQIISTFYNRAG